MSDVPQGQPDLERAMTRYRQAPESKLFAPLAMAYHTAGRTDEAVRVLQAGLSRHPDYVSALVLLGTCNAALHRDEEAEAAFARVLDLDPENLAALRFRAERARRRGALERSVEMLRQVLEIDPFDREVQADLGLLTTALERRAREERPELIARRVPEPPPAPVRPVPEAMEPPHPPAPIPPPAQPPLPESPPPRAEPVIPSPPIQRELPAAAQEPPPPPAIDLRRVGEAPPDTDRWHFTRDDERIVVQPEAPIRGPIRSVEDRLWSERHRQPPMPPPAEPPAVEPAEPERPAPLEVPPAPSMRGEPPPEALPAEPRPLRMSEAPAPRAEFATLTLARIYESQGYYQKALAIYDELRRRHPEDPEIAAGMAALQRRLAGIPQAPPPSEARGQEPPRAWPEVVEEAEESEVEWRLLDSESIDRPQDTAQRLRNVVYDLRDHERARRHTVVGSPPPAPAPSPEPESESQEAESHEDVSRGHPDFERFMSYVRSLRREGGSQ